MVSHDFCIFLISHWWCGLGAESPLRGEIYGNGQRRLWSMNRVNLFSFELLILKESIYAVHEKAGSSLFVSVSD